MLGVVMARAVGGSDPSSALLENLSAGCVFPGLAWTSPAYLCAPSVATCLGKRALRGLPILSPRSAIAASNLHVLEDVGEGLSSGADLGIAIEVLGAVLILVGVLAYFVPRAEAS
jgi:hypothetical protein